MNDFIRLLSGGTNLRVCLVTLNGNGQFELTQAKYRLTEDQKQEDGQKLFDFCAESLATFIKTQLEEDFGKIKPGQELPLGFTVRPFNLCHRLLLIACASSRIPLSESACPPRHRPISTIHHRQERIDHGRLIRWTKGFGAANTEGRDVAEMFRSSLEKLVSSYHSLYLHCSLIFHPSIRIFLSN